LPLGIASYKQITILDSALPRFLNQVLNQQRGYFHPNQDVGQLPIHHPIERLVDFQQLGEGRFVDALIAPVELLVRRRMRPLRVSRRDMTDLAGSRYGSSGQ
jgi:hypothetical protein